MNLPLVKLSIQNGTATVTLNRPEKRNALSRLLLAELELVLNDLHLERRVRAVILTGAGQAFCAGMDLAEMLATCESVDANGRWQHDARLFQGLIEKLLRFPKPVIAAINGPCLAGGVALMLACDLVLAGSNASVALPEAKRGIVAGMATPLLQFRLGGGRAAYLLLSGQSLDAQKAADWGLFHELADDEQLLPRASELAGEIAHQAPAALLMTKKLLNETIAEDLFTHLSAGSAVSASSRTTESATEGLQAFFGKRPPEWP